MADEQPIKPVSLVNRSEKVKTFPVNRSRQGLDPLRRQAFQIRRNDRTHFGPQQFGGRQDHLQGPAFPLHRAIRGRQGVRSAKRAGGQEGPKIGRRSALDDLRGLVPGPSIYIDEPGPFAREVFNETDPDGADEARDGVAVVERGDAYEDVHLAGRRDLPQEIVCEKRVVHIIDDFRLTIAD